MTDMQFALAAMAVSALSMVVNALTIWHQVKDRRLERLAEQRRKSR